MNDDQFTKLFKYLNERFDSVDNDMDEMRGRFNQLQTSVDGIAKSFDD